MNNKILLMVPNYSWFGKRAWNTLPFAIPIIAAVLKNFEFEIIDCNINDYSEDEVAGILGTKEAKLVLISTISYDYYRTYHRLAEIVKQVKPDCTLMMGGVYVTTCVEHVMEDENIDIAMMGHAEERMEPLIDDILNDRTTDIEKTEGIAFRKNGKCIINPLITNVADVKKMVVPDYEKTDIMKYIKKDESIAVNYVNESRKHFANVLSSYGCPYNCIFCASRSISGRKVVVRPAEDVLKEIDFLVRNCGIELLNIMDDNILFDKDRAKYIFREITARQYNIEIRIDNLAIWHLDQEILDIMKEAGVTRMGVSVESGCERVLHKIMRKPLKLEIVKPIRELCRKAGILMTANFMIGLPGETWDEIRESLRFAEDCDFDLISIHIATPLPKTDLYTYAIEYGALSKDYSFFDDSHFGSGVGYLETDEFTPKELETIRAYEWDRINFSTADKRRRACEVLELTEEDLKDLRKQTRIKCGKYFR